MKTKENLPLIIGIALPVLLIAFVAGAIYLPRFFADPPQYDFVYATGDYTIFDYYQVVDGKLTQVGGEMNAPAEILGKPLETYNESSFFIYDIEKDEGRKISFDEARELNLDDDDESPDGYKIVQGSSGGFLGPGNWDKHFLKGHGLSRELDLNLGYYYYNFYFLGWIIPETSLE